MKTFALLWKPPQLPMKRSTLIVARRSSGGPPSSLSNLSALSGPPLASARRIPAEFDPVIALAGQVLAGRGRSMSVTIP
jgi:hypothetical protein